jgi:DNA-binding MarR family transcriptional regulator
MLSATSPTIEECAAKLRAVIAPLERQLRQEGAVGFTPTQVSVIGAIFRHGPIALGELASRERLAPPTISKAVASLERAGIIERVVDPTDRRVCRVVITERGEQWIDESRARRNGWLTQRIGVLTASDRELLAAAIPVLVRLLSEDV